MKTTWTSSIRILCIGPCTISTVKFSFPICLCSGIYLLLADLIYQMRDSYVVNIRTKNYSLPKFEVLKPFISVRSIALLSKRLQTYFAPFSFAKCRSFPVMDKV